MYAKEVSGYAVIIQPQETVHPKSCEAMGFTGNCKNGEAMSNYSGERSSFANKIGTKVACINSTILLYSSPLEFHIFFHTQFPKVYIEFNLF